MPAHEIWRIGAQGRGNFQRKQSANASAPTDQPTAIPRRLVIPRRASHDSVQNCECADLRML